MRKSVLFTIWALVKAAIAIMLLTVFAQHWRQPAYIVVAILGVISLIIAFYVWRIAQSHLRGETLQNKIDEIIVELHKESRVRHLETYIPTPQELIDKLLKENELRAQNKGHSL